MQDFMRVLYTEGFQDLVVQIENTNVETDIITPNRNGEFFFLCEQFLYLYILE